eukprot:m.47225 g.47225  ORF g.47225 m.47225 type:complete len:114 (-) comp10465_c2_seq1:230-571(-)
MNATRGQVLGLYRTLMRTRAITFAGDTEALVASRLKIRDEILKNKNETSLQEINTMIKTGHDVVNILRTNIVQAKRTGDNTYHLKVPKLDSVEQDSNHDHDGNCSCAYLSEKS